MLKAFGNTGETVDKLFHTQMFLTTIAGKSGSGSKIRGFPQLLWCYSTFMVLLLLYFDWWLRNLDKSCDCTFASTKKLLKDMCTLARICSELCSSQSSYMMLFSLSKLINLSPKT